MLPRPVPHFTGRQAELARLRRYASAYSLIVVEGPPGSGKTALALELARDLPGALWIRAGEGWRCENLLYALGEGPWRDGTLSLRERLVLLAGWLDENGRPLFLDDAHRLPDSLELLTAMRELLRRVPLVVTTRIKPAFPPPTDLDALTVRLEGLPEAGELLDLLLEQQGLRANPHQREALLEAAQGFPLLVKLLVSLLRENKLPPRPTAALAAPFLDLLGALGDRERDALEWLAVFDQPVPAEVVGPAALELERRFLVEPSPAGYASHDVFRQFTRASLSPERLAELHRRCADYYAGGDVQARQRAIGHLFEADDKPQARELLVQGQKELFLAGQYDFLLEWNARFPEPRLDIMRADILALLGRTGDALALLEQAEKRGSLDERIQAINSRCHLLLEQGLLEAASEVAREALAVLEGLEGRRPGRVKALNGLALASARQGLVEESLSRAAQARQLAASIDDARGEAYALYAEALAWRHQDRWSESLAAARLAHEACLRAGETRLSYLVRFVEGTALLELGRDASAILNASATYPDPLARAMAEAGRAEWLRFQGCWQEAKEPALRGLEWARQHGGRVFLAQFELVAGRILERLGEKREAAAAFRLGLDLARAAGAGPLAADLELFLGPDRDRLAAGAALPWPGIAERYRQALARCGAYWVATPEGVRREGTVEGLRQEPWELLVDTEAGVARESSLGDVALLRRPVLTRLLRSLALAGKPLTQGELYLEVWGEPYREEESDAQVRKNVSLLRDLLEPDRRSPRYLVAEGRGYRLAGRFCWIERVPPLRGVGVENGK